MHVTSEESVKAYRSVPTSCLDPLESKLGFSHLSIFNQSAERAARAAPNGVKKGATFLLLFRSLNHTDSSRKPFNGVQKGQVHSKKHKPSKKIFYGRSTQGSPTAGLNFVYIISYFWLKVRKLVAYESLVRIPVCDTTFKVLFCCYFSVFFFQEAMFQVEKKKSSRYENL